MLPSLSQIFATTDINNQYDPYNMYKSSPWCSWSAQDVAAPFLYPILPSATSLLASPFLTPISHPSSALPSQNIKSILTPHRTVEKALPETHLTFPTEQSSITTTHTQVSRQEKPLALSEIARCECDSESLSERPFARSSLSTSFSAPDISVAEDSTTGDDALRCSLGHIQKLKKITMDKMVSKKADQELDKSHLTCPVCQHESDSKAALLNHLRSHRKYQGTKVYKCPYCPVIVLDLDGALSAHLKTHTMERKFMCPQCDRGFDDQSTLAKHTRIHSGEKPYSCPLCTMTFRQSGTMNRHIKIMHSESGTASAMKNTKRK